MSSLFGKHLVETKYGKIFHATFNKHTTPQQNIDVDKIVYLSPDDVKRLRKHLDGGLDALARDVEKMLENNQRDCCHFDTLSS